jgi:hypothetical protein
VSGIRICLAEERESLLKNPEEYATVLRLPFSTWCKKHPLPFD